MNLLGFRVFHPPNPPIYGGFLFFSLASSIPDSLFVGLVKLRASACGGYPRIRNFGSISLETMKGMRLFFCVFDISRFLGLLSKASGASASSLLVAGRPSLPGGPRCREALIAGRPSLPGGPRCREALVAGRFVYGPTKRAACGHLVGATSWKSVFPRSAKNVLQILYLMTFFFRGKIRPRFLGLFVESLVGKLSLRRPSLPKLPRRPSLPGPSLPGGPRCRGPSLGFPLLLRSRP